MRTFNYTPSSPFSGKLTNLGISLVMIVFPLVAPFGIRIGSMRILGPTAVTILFVAANSFSSSSNFVRSTCGMSSVSSVTAPLRTTGKVTRSFRKTVPRPRHPGNLFRIISKP